MQNTMKRTLVLAISLLALCCAGLAQPETPAAGGENDAVAPPDAPSETPAEPAAPALTGDVIRLKSGKVISGAQVIRKAPTILFVQVLPGVEPLQLPLSQVESVEYDDIDSLHQRPQAPPTAPVQPPDYMEGRELSPELSKKLRASISDTPLSIQNEDYVTALTRIAERMNIPLTFGPKVQALSPDARLWSAEVPAGTSFIQLLYDHLLKVFPRVKETYEYGQMQLTLRRPDEPGPLPVAPPLPEPDAAVSPEVAPAEPPALPATTPAPPPATP
jgi:hypothetical protein